MSLSDEIDLAFQHYLDKVAGVAKREFQRNIKPVLDRERIKLSVLPSWGEWWLDRITEDGDKRIDVDYPHNRVGLETVLYFLEREVPGCPQSDFGCFMDSYTPKEK